MMGHGRLVYLLLTTTPLKSLQYSSVITLARHRHRFDRARTMASSNEMDSSVGLSDIGGGGSDEGEPDEPVLSWRSRINDSIARSRKIRGSNYVQIATIDPDTMEPRCRTVVFRGFQKLLGTSSSTGSDGAAYDGMSCVMKMITDNRSNKVSEASKHPRQTAEMVWWFPKSSEQYRIRGKLEFVGSGTFPLDDDDHYSLSRKEQWGNLSDTAREQFFWKDPGVSYSGESAVPMGGRDSNGKVLPPPDNFLLMLLFPSRVDYLRLGDNFRQVDEVSGGDWAQVRLNP